MLSPIVEKNFTAKPPRVVVRSRAPTCDLFRGKRCRGRAVFAVRDGTGTALVGHACAACAREFVNRSGRDEFCFGKLELWRS